VIAISASALDRDLMTFQEV